MLKTLRQRGDTIVEVLICLAIASFSISINYSLSRASLRKIRDAEERAQATQLAQGQIEKLRAFLHKHPDIKTSPTDATTSYVLNPNGDPSGGCTNSNTKINVKYSNSALAQCYNEPGFCIYSDLNSMHFVGFDNKDPKCALNQYGQYYCEVAVPGNPLGLTPCSAGFPLSGNPAQVTAVDDAGFYYRAGFAYGPLALCPPSNCPGTPVTQAGNYLYPPVINDQFESIAGRLEVGGDGVNAQLITVVAIPYRIHQ